MAALKARCVLLCCFAVFLMSNVYGQTNGTPTPSAQEAAKTKHEFPSVKYGVWNLEITGPSGEKHARTQNVCDSLDLDFIFMGKFYDLGGGLTEVGLALESKKLSDTEYLITSKASTQRKGAAIIVHHVTMNGTTAFTDSAVTTQQKRVTKHSMEGHWVQECPK